MGNLAGHAAADMLAEHPQLVTSLQEPEPKPEAQSPLLRVCVIQHLRVEQVRRNRRMALTDRILAAPDRKLRIRYDIPDIRGGDVNQFSAGSASCNLCL